MIEYWIDIPNLQTVNLPYSFQYVESISVTSICMNMNEWIDVSRKLANLVPVTYSRGYIESIKPKVISIHLSDWTCNDIDYTIFNFSRFTLLKKLIIGSNSFCSVNKFVIDGLNELKCIKIGNNSFTKKKNNFGNDSSRSFSILNCIELKSIEIGHHSFSDYGGEFELINLPKLSTIKIGEIGSDSRNFCYSSFEIKGIINMLLIMNRSSTFEFHWIRKLCIPIFLINSDIKYLNELNEYLIDLLNLNSINLGRLALAGRNNDDCSLLMESDIDMNKLIIDLPNLTFITSEGDSFIQPHLVTLSSLILNDWILNRYSESSNSSSLWFIQICSIQSNH